LESAVILASLRARRNGRLRDSTIYAAVPRIGK
jgi:hypothetical protein